jgi:16S rRNA (cytosine967-C5)-methyltransferase
MFGRSVTDAPVESTGLSMNARRVALDVLCDVYQNGAFASLSLDEHLRSAKLRPEDRRLVTSIVYGTLENELKIDFALARHLPRRSVGLL